MELEVRAEQLLWLLCEFGLESDEIGLWLASSVNDSV